MKKVIEEAYEGKDITVDYGLRHLKGNSRPYFHITASTRREQSNEVLAKALTFHPELSCIVPLHLSDDNGLPLHAVENGWYWLGFTQWTDFNPEITANHFRISEEDAIALHARLTKIHNSCSGGKKIADEMVKNHLRDWVDQQMPRWKEEAEFAINVLKLVVEYE